MSHAYGIATRLKVSKTAPASLIDFLDYIYGIGKYVDDEVKYEGGVLTIVGFDIFKMMADRLCGVVLGNSGYMQTWRWRVKEDAGDHWVYESRAGHGYKGMFEFTSLVSSIQPYLLLNEGDIVYRAVYEESPVETVLYFTESMFKEKDGYQYSHYEGWLTDDRHPYNEKLYKEHISPDSGRCTYQRNVRQTYGSFLPWNVSQIKNSGS